jgi:putative zinc finger/helix-turn-helix YgiT family protein
MRCLECGGNMTMTREDVPYDEVGLRGITLVDVEHRRCQSCDEDEVVIVGMEDLHRSIAKELILKPGRLTASEIRFLRTWLGLTGAAVASYLGVSNESVSRWENGHAQIEVPTERLLRLLAARKEPCTDLYQELPNLAVGTERKPLRGVAKRSPRGWRLKPAA